MKILHTADWHIGQLFHEYDRTHEHRQFLDWLVETLQEKAIDVLLISGDVFDLSNPSAASIRLFYTFLNKATRNNPDLQIVITAGNHDSASRLESPKPLLESSNIHIVGHVEKDEAGNIDYSKLVVPLKGRDGLTEAWCLAVPFLRMGDYPAIAGCENPYAEGVAALYQEAYNHVAQQRQDGQAIIAMGHLHAQQAEVSDMDKSERLIMGGVESISAQAFHADIRYVALGHIHKAQRIGGQEHIRYCGSPIPMSFSEINYKHQVITFQVEAGKVEALQAIEVPVSVPLLRVPSVHSSLQEVLQALAQLPEPVGVADAAPAPYLEVRVLLDGPEPGLRHKVESAIVGKNVRLAKIDTRYPAAIKNPQQEALLTADKLHELKPFDVFSTIYQSRYNSDVPADLLALFHQVSQEISQAD